MNFRFALLLLPLLFTNIVFSQEKKAFIVAIGDYAPLDGKGWKKISSVNDTTYILPALRKQGFDKKNTTVLINQQASIEGLRNGLENFTNTLKENDVVVIHISAHGAQIEDDNEDELDGLDESIVTYNAIRPGKSENFADDQLQYMRDDEFGIYIEKMRQILGSKGDLVVFMDNCHSGSATRNVGEIVRGGEPALTSKKNNANTAVKDLAVFKEKSKTTANLASYVIISAARAEELNTEIKVANQGVGSLSYAISKTFEQMTAHKTYSGFFAQIQSSMNVLVPRQHPVIEGDGLDRSLFGGKYIIQPNFIELKSIEDPTLIIVHAGIIAGLTEKSEVAFYPSGTSDTSSVKASALGKVIWSDNFIAGIELDRPLLKDQAFDYWAFIKKTHYPINPVVFTFESGISKAEQQRKEQYQKVLASNPMLVFEGKSNLILSFGDKYDTLTDCHSGVIWQKFDSNLDYSQALIQSIERYAQYQFLKSYMINDANFPVTIKLIPYCNGKPDTTLLTQKMMNGVAEFKKGDSIVLCISNHSNRRIYINVVDLQPDGIINPIFPRKVKNIRPEELFIEANTIDKVFSRYPIALAPPYGDEVFKVFISKDKLDLEYITQTKKDGTRNFMTDLEKVFKSSYAPSTRGEFGSKEGSVVNLNFRIVE